VREPPSLPVFGKLGVKPSVAVVAAPAASVGIVPRLRDGDFAGGIDAGVDRILRTIDGEPLPPPASPPGRCDPAMRS